MQTVSTTTKIPSHAVPRSAQDQLDWLRLIRSRRVGAKTFVRLIREHGDAGQALAALPTIAAESGVNNYQIFEESRAEAELKAAKKAGAQMLCLGSDNYPAPLALIDDPPPVLWAVGDTGIFEQMAVALVGARNASSVGRRLAKRLAAGLADSDIAVVSGLARGIDAEAHGAACAAGTVAVLAGGVDICYPQENAELFARIPETGIRLSEMPMGMQPQARHFPRRNRIISGLSRAVVVIEGAARSGSLITARDALDQGREVMAVPGSPIEGRSAGCNMLIRDGATLITSVQDILDVVRPPMPKLALVEPPSNVVELNVPQAKSAPEENISGDILALLSATPIAEDTLIRQVDYPSQQVLSTLSMLELSNRIARHGGGFISVP